MGRFMQDSANISADPITFDTVDIEIVFMQAVELQLSGAQIVELMVKSNLKFRGQRVRERLTERGRAYGLSYAQMRATVNLAECAVGYGTRAVADFEVVSRLPPLLFFELFVPSTVTAHEWPCVFGALANLPVIFIDFKHRASPPVIVLTDDLLCMVFLEARELDDLRERWWKSNVAISHVCRRWRQQALSLARLWDALYWAPGKSLDAAMTALERSGRTTIAVRLQMHCPLREVAAAADIVTSHALLRAVLPHLGRVSDLDLWLSVEYWDAELFAPLCSPTAAAMPALYSLKVWNDSPMAVPLNIACPDLRWLDISEFPIRDWGRMAGARTTSVQIGGFDLNLSDVVLLLQNAPNMINFCIGAMFKPTAIVNDMTPHTLAAATDAGFAAAQSLNNLEVLDMGDPSLEILRDLFPIDRIERVDVVQNWANPPHVEWLHFLRVPGIGDVEELKAFGDYSECIELSAAQGARIRALGGHHSSSLLCLPEVLDQHPILNTLQALSLDVLDWSDFCDMVETRGARMSALRTLEFSLNQSALKKRGGRMVEYDGERIDLPALRLLEISLSGHADPSVDLVRHLLEAILPILRFLHEGSVECSGLPERRAALRAHCHAIASDDDEERAVQALASTLPLLLPP